MIISRSETESPVLPTLAAAYAHARAWFADDPQEQQPPALTLDEPAQMSPRRALLLALQAKEAELEKLVEGRRRFDDNFGVMQQQRADILKALSETPEEKS